MSTKERMKLILIGGIDTRRL